MSLLSNGMPFPFYLRVLIPRPRPVPESPLSVTEENASSSSSMTQALRVKSPSELNTNDPLRALSLNTATEDNELINTDSFDEEDPLISSSTDLSPRPISPGNDAFIPFPEEETKSKEKLMDSVHGENKMEAPEEVGKPVLPGKEAKRKRGEKAAPRNRIRRKIHSDSVLSPFTNGSEIYSDEAEGALENILKIELGDNILNCKRDDLGMNSTSCAGAGALKKRKINKEPIENTNLTAGNKEPGTRFQCDFCTYSTNFTFSFKRHLTTHTGLRLFACDICDKRYATKYELTRHKNWHAGLNTGSEITFQCSVCAYSSNSKFAFNRHLTTHTGRPFACDVCDKLFATKYELTKHKRSHPGLRPYVCELCGKDFSREVYLLDHQRRLHPGTKEELLECERCGKKYPSKSSLALHLKSHSAERSNRCFVCGIAFLFPYSLTKHLKRHQPKSFPCGQCDRAFVTLHERKMHEAQHTGEKPHACNTCGTSFVKRSHLENHIRIHTGEKPFKCGHCGISFSRTGTLKRHIKKIHAHLTNYTVGTTL